MCKDVFVNALLTVEKGKRHGQNVVMITVGYYRFQERFDSECGDP